MCKIENNYIMTRVLAWLFWGASFWLVVVVEYEQSIKDRKCSLNSIVTELLPNNFGSLNFGETTAYGNSLLDFISVFPLISAWTLESTFRAFVWGSRVKWMFALNSARVPSFR